MTKVENQVLVKTSVADPDPGSGAFLTPGSQNHIFESLMTIFWIKSSIILWKAAQIFFFSNSNTKQFSVLWNLWLQNKVWQKKFFTPLFCCWFWIRDPRSGIRGPGWVKIRIRDPGSGINIPDPQHRVKLWHSEYVPTGWTQNSTLKNVLLKNSFLFAERYRNQWSGSGSESRSGSTGATCFWASRIRIH